jgi:hypothetical protein
MQKSPYWGLSFFWELKVVFFWQLRVECLSEHIGIYRLRWSHIVGQFGSEVKVYSVS